MIRFSRKVPDDRPPPPAIRDGLLIYAVGDIHGRADCLQNVFERIDRDRQRVDHDQYLEIYVGDYVDRGLHSAQVIDLLIQRLRAHPVITLRGNHEIMMAKAITDLDSFVSWRDYGGLETIASYGIQLRLPITPEGLRSLHAPFKAAVPRAHIHFLSNTFRIVFEGDYCFVHAGVRPGIDLEEQRDEDIYWIREPFLRSKRWHGRMIVHGHTPVARPEVKSNRINIDTGAFITGTLTCARFVGTDVTFI